MTLLIALVLVGLVVWFRVRRRRASRLAGLDSGRPQFMVEPPRRRIGSRRREAL